jgi:hypothetical protein
MKGVIISKFRQWEERSPILLVAYHTLQILLQDLIDAFCLAICLWMECYRELGGSAENLEESFPKMRNKWGTTIRDDAIG